MMAKNHHPTKSLELLIASHKITHLFILPWCSTFRLREKGTRWSFWEKVMRVPSPRQPGSPWCLQRETGTSRMWRRCWMGLVTSTTRRSGMSAEGRPSPCGTGKCWHIMLTSPSSGQRILEVGFHTVILVCSYYEKENIFVFKVTISIIFNS